MGRSSSLLLYRSTFYECKAHSLLSQRQAQYQLGRIIFAVNEENKFKLYVFRKNCPIFGSAMGNIFGRYFSFIINNYYTIPVKL